MKSKAKIYQIVIVGLSIAAILAAVLFSSFSYAFTEVKQVSAAETDNTSFNVVLPASSGSSFMYDNVLVLTRASNFSGDWYDNEVYLRWYIDGSPHIFEEGSSFSFTLYAFCNSAFNFSLSGGAFYNTGLTGYVSIHSEGVSTDTSDCLYFNLSDQPIYVYNVFGTVTDTSGNVYNFSLFPDSNDNLFFDQIKSCPLSLNTNQTFVYPFGSEQRTNVLNLTVNYSGIGSFKSTFYSSDGIEVGSITSAAAGINYANGLSASVNTVVPSFNYGYVVISPITEYCDIYVLSYQIANGGYYSVCNSTNLWKNFMETMTNSNYVAFDANSSNYANNFTLNSSITNTTNFPNSTVSYDTSSEYWTYSFTNSFDGSNSFLDYNLSISSLTFTGLISYEYYLKKGVPYEFVFDSFISNGDTYFTKYGYLYKWQFGWMHDLNSPIIYVGDLNLNLFTQSVEFTPTSDVNRIVLFLTRNSSSITSDDYPSGSYTGKLSFPTLYVREKYSDSFESGYDLGYNDGYDKGYNQGVNVSIDDVNGTEFIGAVVDGVFNMLDSQVFGYFSLADILFVAITFMVFFLAMRLIR